MPKGFRLALFVLALSVMSLSSAHFASAVSTACVDQGGMCASDCNSNFTVSPVKLGCTEACCLPKAQATTPATPAVVQPLSTGGDVGGGLDSTAKSGGLKSVANDIPSAIGSLIGNALGVLGALMLVYFIYGGVRWMTAAGDGKATQDAVTIIRNAVIGMMIIGMSYMFADFAFKAVQNTMQGGSGVQQAK
jgi:hypothetical protein